MALSETFLAEAFSGTLLVAESTTVTFAFKVKIILRSTSNILPYVGKKYIYITFKVKITLRFISNILPYAGKSVISADL